MNYNLTDWYFSPRAYNSASRYSMLGNLNRRNRSVGQNSHPESIEEPEPPHPNLASNEVDHSGDLSSDFSKFLFEDQLANVQISVSKFPQPLKEIESPKKDCNTVTIPAHRIVLASRCQYFYSKFCREWGDGKALVATFPEFTETPMREFIRYLYTGKLKIQLSSVMGIMRISCYFNMDELVKSCKNYLKSDKLNAFDLCILYCEVREGA